MSRNVRAATRLAVKQEFFASQATNLQLQARYCWVPLARVTFTWHRADLDRYYQSFAARRAK